MNSNRVLISTIQARTGGVPEMVRFAADCVVEAGYPVVIGYYLPYSVSPELSVPCFKLFRGKVGEQAGTAINGFEAHGFGAWLPELEFTHYLPTRQWKELVWSCRYYIAVSGNCLAATPFALLERAYVAWVATDWSDDRKGRANHLPWPRKVLDFAVNRHVIRRFEKLILERGTVAALSRHTRERLNARGAGKPLRRVLPMPVDLERFLPAPEKVVPRRIGFAGRLDDPRKNLGLLLRAAAACRRRGGEVTVELIGGDLPPDLSGATASSGPDGALRIVDYLPPDRLAERLQALDVFVVPSLQEGLCIAAIEAMACGCPVVSTRCGGPEEYVIDGSTGYLADAEPDAMADAVLRIVEDRGLRAALSGNARALVEKNYNAATAKRIFWDAFYEAFPQ